MANLRVVVRHVHCLHRRLTTSALCWAAEVKPSYWHMPSTEPLTSLTVGHLLEQSALRWNDREAFVSCHQGHRFTFGQVLEQVDKVAAGLLELGLNRGDRVGLWGPDSSQWYLTNLAAARAGLILVNINPAYQIPELEYCLTKVDVKALVTHDTFKTQNYHQMVQSIAPELASCKPGELRSEKFPELRSLIVMSEQHLPGAFRFKDVIESASPTTVERIQQLQSEIQADEGCNIQFTSGTTGQPKGTLLSHHNVVNNSYFMGRRIGLHLKHHRICLQVPLFHAFGNIIGTLCALQHGSTLVVAAPRFQPEDSIHSIHKEKCTVMYGTPTMHIDVISKVEELKASMPSLEVAVTAGALCSPHLYQKLKKTIGLKRISSIYGMTETSPASFLSLPDDPEEKSTGSVGKVLEHTEVKVVDEQGKMVPMGKPGELWVRGYLNMLGYWGDEQKTKDIMGPDRWLKTGDKFVLSEDGYGEVVGRIKDMIIRGGENIFPKEIEEYLQTHPDVVEAQVLGVPDERFGEEVCAYIRLRPGSNITQDDLKGYCKNKIAHFKIPKHIKFVTDFPKTVSGKIQKFKLKEIFKQEQASKVTS